MMIQLLDTTLRDGGLGLEDAAKNGYSTASFDTKTIKQIIDCLKKSEVDIVELGSIERTNNDMRRFAIFQDIQGISEMIPPNRPDNQIYAALYRGPDTPVADIPEWRAGYCEAVRVILRYSELDKSLNFCKELSKKGYAVFVQPMLTMRYTDGELQKVIDVSNEMNAYALYFVDSYGYMQKSDIKHFFTKFDSELKPGIRIGFHAHNNMNLAFSNAQIFLEQKTDRGIIIDSCALGMGQGAGNLQTEVIADHLNRQYDRGYNYDSILELCELVSRYWTDNLWGYSIIHFLPARHRAAYKYAVAMQQRYKLSLVEIDHLLNLMPLEMRQRYTPQNLEIFLRQKNC